MSRLLLLGVGGANALAPGALTYIGSTEAASGAGTATFTNHAIGTAAADRLVILGLTNVRASQTPRTLSGVTIGGVAATVHISGGNTNGTVGPTMSIASLVVTSGTTATIVATYSGAATTCVVHVWTLTGYVSATPTHSQSNAVASGDPSVGLNITGPGVAVGIWHGDGTPAGAAFTGLATEDYDATVTSLSARAAAAHATGLSTETPRTISVASTMGAEILTAASWN